MATTTKKPVGKVVKAVKRSMPELKFVPPTLGHNITPEFLVDEIGIARAQKSFYEKAEGFYKEAFKGRTKNLKQTSFQGEHFVANIQHLTRVTLDQDAIRKQMGEEWCKQFERVTEYVQIATKRI